MSSFSIRGRVVKVCFNLKEIYFEGGKKRLKGIEGLNLEHWL